MPIEGDLGFSYLVVGVVLIGQLVIGFFVRRKWRRAAARAKEFKLLAIAAAEAARAELEASVGYSSSPAPAPVGYSSSPAPAPVGYSSSQAPAPVSLPFQYHQCVVCFSPTTTRCARCKSVRYCSGKCQIIHWRQGHKEECRPFISSHESNGVGGSYQRVLKQEEQKTLGNSIETDGKERNSSLHEKERSDEHESTNVFPDKLEASCINNVDEKGQPRSKSTVLVDSVDCPTSSVKLNQIKPECSDEDSEGESANSSGWTVDGSNESSFSDPSTPSSGFWEGTINSSKPKVDDALDDSAESGFIGADDANTQNPRSLSYTSKFRRNAVPTVVEQGSDSKTVKMDELYSSDPRYCSSSTCSSPNSSAGGPSISTHALKASSISSLIHEKSSHVVNDTSTTPRPLESKDDKSLSSSASVTHVNPSKVESAQATATTDYAHYSPNDRNEVKTPMQKVVGQLRAFKGSEMTGRYSIKGLFPYKLFVKLYNCNKVELRPFGLTNCGNSCYANAVLQCLACTPPLTAYLLQGGHRKACERKDWCFTCEFESLILKAKEGISPLSPMGILSQIGNIGSHLGNGKEEDAHEFLRYAIDTMQSVCLKEAGVSSASCLEEETSLIGLTFGGYLRSKIRCLKCGGKSERHERTMDLTIEIDGDIGTLEDALRKFTGTEILDGENKYQCTRCRSYERAKKKLTVQEAPNILTIELKRFQSISSSQVVLNPLEQSTKNVAHVARPDQCSATVPLPEKKMARKTLKRKCRTMSVMFEIHQQHFVKRYEGTAKSFRVTRICRKHGINRVSTVKRIHKQHRIHQWPFRQKWATRRGYSLGEKRPFEASILSMDEKHVSRFLFIPMSQFPRSSPWPLALTDGSEIVGPIALLMEFAARKTRAHLVKRNQSGSTASHYERKNTRGTSGRQGITESTSSREDFQPHFGCKHEDAVKRLGVKVSIFKSSCRKHLVYWLPCQIKENDQGIPTVSHSELENKRETLKRGCSVLGLEDLRQHYGGRHEDAMQGLSDSVAWRSFKVLVSVPLGEQPISQHFAQRRALTHKHCVRRKKSQDLPRSPQIDCSGGLAGQSAVSLPDGGYILSLSEKKIVGKTLKRKCRTMSVFSLEDHHQQHGVRGWEDAAKSLGRKCICRQLVIQDVSKAKRIRRQHVINQWPIQQNWATIKAYSVGDKRPTEVISLGTDGKLVSRLQLIHISWLGKFLPRPSASPGGGETAGPIALLSSDVATNNRAHITRNDQSGSSASHSEKKRPGEPEDLEGTNRSISLEDLEHLFDMKREDAAKILDVSVSKLKRICRQHGIERWPYRVTNKAVKKPPDRHRGMNTIGSSDDRRNLSASQEGPLLRGHVSGPIYRTISSCTDPAPGQPTPIVPHPTRNLLASEEEVLLWGHVSGPIYGTISSCTEPAPSQPMPIGPHPAEDLEDQRNLLALPEEPLLSQITPTIPPTMDGFADWSAVSALFDNSFPEGHASGSIDCTVPGSSNPALSQPMPTNATERQNMDFVELKATYGDTTIKFQLPPMFETSELKEKVSKILECELGSFKVEYKDKDGEWILMGCDENVREYLQLLNSLGKQVTKLKISDKVPNTTNLCETCGSSLTRKRPRHVQM